MIVITTFKIETRRLDNTEVSNITYSKRYSSQKKKMEPKHNLNIYISTIGLWEIMTK